MTSNLGSGDIYDCFKFWSYNYTIYELNICQNVWVKSNFRCAEVNSHLTTIIWLWKHCSTNKKQHRNDFPHSEQLLFASEPVTCKKWVLGPPARSCPMRGRRCSDSRCVFTMVKYSCWTLQPPPGSWHALWAGSNAWTMSTCCGKSSARCRGIETPDSLWPWLEHWVGKHKWWKEPLNK